MGDSFQYQCQSCNVVGELDEYHSSFKCPECGGAMIPLNQPNEPAPYKLDDDATIAIPRDSIPQEHRPVKVAKAVDLGFGGILTSSSATGKFSPASTSSALTSSQPFHAPPPTAPAQPAQAQKPQVQPPPQSPSPSPMGFPATPSQKSSRSGPEKTSQGKRTFTLSTKQKQPSTTSSTPRGKITQSLPKAGGKIKKKNAPMQKKRSQGGVTRTGPAAAQGRQSADSSDVAVLKAQLEAERRARAEAEKKAAEEKARRAEMALKRERKKREEAERLAKEAAEKAARKAAEKAAREAAAKAKAQIEREKRLAQKTGQSSAGHKPTSGTGEKRPSASGKSVGRQDSSKTTSGGKPSPSAKTKKPSGQRPPQGAPGSGKSKHPGSSDKKAARKGPTSTPRRGKSPTSTSTTLPKAKTKTRIGALVIEDEEIHPELLKIHRQKKIIVRTLAGVAVGASLLLLGIALLMGGGGDERPPAGPIASPETTASPRVVNIPGGKPVSSLASEYKTLRRKIRRIKATSAEEYAQLIQMWQEFIDKHKDSPDDPNIEKAKKQIEQLKEAKSLYEMK